DKLNPLYPLYANGVIPVARTDGPAQQEKSDGGADQPIGNPSPANETHIAAPQPNRNVDPVANLICPFPGRSGLTDIQIFHRAATSKQGAKFLQYWSGKLDGDATDLWRKSAELGLASQLAFWSGKDEAQMDRMFRASGLMTPEWDMQTA